MRAYGLTVASIDYDGCADTVEGRNSISANLSSSSQTLVYIGSTRQDHPTDEWNAKNNSNGSCFSEFRNFCYLNGYTFISRLLADRHLERRCDRVVGAPASCTGNAIGDRRITLDSIKSTAFLAELLQKMPPLQTDHFEESKIDPLLPELDSLPVQLNRLGPLAFFLREMKVELLWDQMEDIGRYLVVNDERNPVDFRFYEDRQDILDVLTCAFGGGNDGDLEEEFKKWLVVMRYAAWGCATKPSISCCEYLCSIFGYSDELEIQCHLDIAYNIQVLKDIQNQWSQGVACLPIPDSVDVHLVQMRRGARLYEHFSHIGGGDVLTDSTASSCSCGHVCLLFSHQKPLYFSRQGESAAALILGGQGQGQG